ncbi:MAG: HAD family hydrolase [Candidatus Nanohaloarchaea archaeon]
MDYEAVVFDLDGTLIESSADDISWLYGAVRAALREFERSGAAEELEGRALGKLAGIDGYKEYVSMCEKVELRPREFWSHVSHHRAQAKLQVVSQGDLGERAGATGLLESLHSRGLELGVVSNAPDEEVEKVVMERNWQEFLKFFRGVTGLDDLVRRKPDPWHIEMARAELHRDTGLYVGDSRVDIEAAEGAGWDSVHLGEGERASYSVDELNEIESIIR